MQCKSCEVSDKQTWAISFLRGRSSVMLSGLTENGFDLHTPASVLIYPYTGSTSRWEASATGVLDDAPERNYLLECSVRQLMSAKRSNGYYSSTFQLYVFNFEEYPRGWPRQVGLLQTLLRGITTHRGEGLFLKEWLVCTSERETYLVMCESEYFACSSHFWRPTLGKLVRELVPSS